MEPPAEFSNDVAYKLFRKLKLKYSDSILKCAARPIHADLLT